MLFKRLFDWLVPLTCFVCGFKSNHRCCQDCLNELPWIQNACAICASELPAIIKDPYCAGCLIDPPPIAYSVILFHYKAPIPSLVKQLKFQNKLRLANPLGELLAKCIRERYASSTPLPTAILPIPLHRNRLSHRGYNQALEIAKPISRKLKIPIDYQSVVRIKATLPQTLVDIKNRQANVKGAFSVEKHLQDEHVAIVDDVVTTFSTLTEMANLLHQSGVKRIDAWCLARA